jgi:CDP-diacylglycerol--glycerol-3-phosphate 3-phosphatidyltransferase
MVIVAREFAVSSLRVAAAAEGAIIPASILGKIKTVIQVIAVMALIAANDPHATWVDVLVGLMVFATVASGVDYFLNVRREIEDARANLRAQRSAARAGVDTSRSSSSSREVPRM